GGDRAAGRDHAGHQLPRPPRNSARIPAPEWAGNLGILTTPHPPFGHLLPALRGEGKLCCLSPRVSGERVALSERSESKGRVKGAALHHSSTASLPAHRSTSSIPMRPPAPRTRSRAPITTAPSPPPSSAAMSSGCSFTPR